MHSKEGTNINIDQNLDGNVALLVSATIDRAEVPRTDGGLSIELDVSMGDAPHVLGPRGRVRLHRQLGG